MRFISQKERTFLHFLLYSSILFLFFSLLFLFIFVVCLNLIYILFVVVCWRIRSRRMFRWNERRSISQTTSLRKVAHLHQHFQLANFIQFIVNSAFYWQKTTKTEIEVWNRRSSKPIRLRNNFVPRFATDIRSCGQSADRATSFTPPW